MIYTYRRQLLIILTVIFLTISGVVIYNLIQPKKDTTIKKVTIPTSQEIKNLDNTKDFPLSDTTREIVQSYITTTMTAKHKNNTYSATARDGSYHQTVSPDGSTLVSLLIDVLPFKETYYFYRATDSSQLDTSAIRCAPEAQQMIHPSVCKDLSND